VWWPASDESTPAYPGNRVAGLVQQLVNQKEPSRKSWNNATDLCKGGRGEYDSTSSSLASDRKLIGGCWVVVPMWFGSLKFPRPSKMEIAGDLTI
jgi:hypothetical protein